MQIGYNISTLCKLSTFTNGLIPLKKGLTRHIILCPDKSDILLNA